MDNGLRFLEMLMKDFQIAASVSFHFLKPATLTDRRALKSFLIQLVKTETKLAADLSFVFCSDTHLRKMNKQFLNHDYYTDILSFPLENGAGLLSGEMYLSVDRIRDNARALDFTFDLELHRVIFHGVLHLCGYKDKKPADIAKMRSKENFYLNKYFKK